ncbi:hypothetical protein M1N78_02000 [Peptococcaceae bacterium]|nr:hypothetical protein [Peptococcaceae bacterium]
MPPSRTLRSLTLASVLSHSDNKRVSGFATLRPNPRCARTSDTRQPLGEMPKPVCRELEERKMSAALYPMNMFKVKLDRRF